MAQDTATDQFRTDRMRNAWYWAAQAAGWFRDGPNAGIDGQWYVEVVAGKPTIVLDSSFDQSKTRAVIDGLRDAGFPPSIRVRELDDETRLFMEPNGLRLRSNYDDEWRSFECMGGFDSSRLE